MDPMFAPVKTGAVEDSNGSLDWYSLARKPKCRDENYHISVIWSASGLGSPNSPASKRASSSLRWWPGSLRFVSFAVFVNKWLSLRCKDFSNSLSWLGDRFCEHLRSVSKTADLPVAKHFSSPGHTTDDMMVAVVRAGLHNNGDRRRAEGRLIFKCKTLQPRGRNIDFNFIWANSSSARFKCCHIWIKWRAFSVNLCLINLYLVLSLVLLWLVVPFFKILSFI